MICIEELVKAKSKRTWDDERQWHRPTDKILLAFGPLTRAAAQRLTSLLALGLSGLGLFVGCSRTTPVQQGYQDGVFHFAINQEPADLDPNTNISADANPVFTALYEGLVVLSNDGKTLTPGVAERWEISPDGLTYTFHLRADARWSNGEPVTADDFVFSFRRVFDPKLGSEEASYGYMIVGSRAYNEGTSADPSTVGVSAPDPRTFVVHLVSPTAYFLAMLSVGTPFDPVYRPLLEKFNSVHERGGRWTREGNLVSNGPFALATWQQDKLIAVKRNPYYWDRARIALAEIDFHPVDEAGAQERGFRAGQFHATQNFPISREAAYRDVSPSPLRKRRTLNSHFITFNVAHFPDARVRRALSLALDRERMVPAVYGGFAEPAHSLTRDGAGGFHPAFSSACRFDPAEAKRLMAAAGYPNGQGFPAIDLMLVGNDQETVRMGEVVQEAWKNVLGVSTHLLPTEHKVYLDAERTHQFSAVIERWGASWDDPTAVLETVRSGDPNNDSGWGSPAFDQAENDAEGRPASPERTHDFEVDEAILATEVPYAPLFYANYGTLVDPGVHGIIENQLSQMNWKEISFGR